MSEDLGAYKGTPKEPNYMPDADISQHSKERVNAELHPETQGNSESSVEPGKEVVFTEDTHSEIQDLLNKGNSPGENLTNIARLMEVIQGESVKNESTSIGENPIQENLDKKTRQGFFKNIGQVLLDFFNKFFKKKR